MKHALLTALALLPTVAWPAEDVSRLSLEDLLRVEVEGASRYAQPLAEAPSSATVVSAEDIRRFGFRTVSEALRMAPGVYTTNDRAYNYLGIRGFGRPGDYNSRLLLLVDGSRRNDVVYDQAMVGHESPVEMDWLKQLEFVPGPSSAVHGGNALFGVANAVLWSGAELNGSRVTAELGSGGMSRVGLLSGRRTAEGTDWVAGVSAYRRRGEDPYFREFDQPGVADGVARGLDGERYLKAFLKVANGGWRVSLGYADRRKDVPTAYYGTDFGVPGNFVVDRQGHADIAHSANLGGDWDQAVRLHAGSYRYEGEYVFGATAGTTGRDETRAEWWGGEYRLTYTGIRDHKVLLGAEAQRNRRVEQRYFDIAPRIDYLDDRRNSSSIGVFIQDEWRFAPRWLANLGLRLDRLSGFAAEASPRFALIYHPLPEATLKLLHGRAFRPPNAYERHYHDGYITQKPGVDLKPERIVSSELAADWAVTPSLRLTGNYYRYRLANLVDQVTDPTDGLLVFVNQPSIHARGVEAGAEALLAAGWRLRGSVAVQRVRQANGEPVNSPRRLGKLLVDGPLSALGWVVGLHLQAIGPRDSVAGRVPGHVTGNLTVRTGRLTGSGEWTLGIYNLADRAYLEPASVEHTQAALPQDGRQLRLRWEKAL